MLFIAAFLFAILFCIWLFQSPTIKPDEINLKGQIIPYQDTASPKNPKGERYEYVTEIELNTNQNEKLYQTEKYEYSIYLYLDGYAFPVWDFPNKQEDEPAIHDEQFHIGDSPQTYQQAYKALAEYREPANTEVLENGFTYTGSDYPALIRYYILNQGETPRSSHSYMIYSHHEWSWGKDLSWVKIVPFDSP